MRDDSPDCAAAATTASGTDWSTVRQRYVEGVAHETGHQWPTLEAVADHFNISPDRVRKVSASEGWVSRRREWQVTLDRERQRRKADKAAAELAVLDDLAIEAAKCGLRLTLSRLVSCLVDGATLSARELVDVARAAEVFHRLGLSAIGSQAPVPSLTTVLPAPDVDDFLRRDDPDRIAAVLCVLQEAGVLGTFPIVESDDDKADVEIDEAVSSLGTS